jgi:hypothetical protein
MAETLGREFESRLGLYSHSHDCHHHHRSGDGNLALPAELLVAVHFQDRRGILTQRRKNLKHCSRTGRCCSFLTISRSVERSGGLSSC